MEAEIIQCHRIRALLRASRWPWLLLGVRQIQLLLRKPSGSLQIGTAADSDDLSAVLNPLVRCGSLQRKRYDLMIYATEVPSVDHRCLCPGHAFRLTHSFLDHSLNRRLSLGHRKSHQDYPACGPSLPCSCLSRCPLTS